MLGSADVKLIYSVRTGSSRATCFQQNFKMPGCFYAVFNWSYAGEWVDKTRKTEGLGLNVLFFCFFSSPSRDIVTVIKILMHTYLTEICM